MSVWRRSTWPFFRGKADADAGDSPDRFRQRLSIQLAGYAIFIGLLLGLLLSGAQVALDLLDQRRRMDESVRQVISTVLGSAVEAAYNVDDRLARRVALGLFEYGPIISVVVTDEMGNLLAEAQRPPGPAVLPRLTRVFFGENPTYEQPLILQFNNMRVGRITVTADSGQAAIDFFRRARVTLVGDLIRNLLLAAILSLVFYHWVARPLRKMARHVRAVDPACPARSPIQAPAVHSANELGLLAFSINRLLDASQRSLDSRRAAQERLRRQNEYLNALHETAMGLIRRLEPRDLLRTLIHRAGRLSGATEGFLYLYDPEGDALEVRAGFGLFEDQIGFRIAVGEGLAGRVWRDGRPRVVANYSDWPGRLPNPIFHGLGAIAAIPVRSGDYVTGGVIGVVHTRPDAGFDEADIAILERFAELASIVLDNAELYARLQAELAERERSEAERRKMEARLLQSQKMEAIGTLAGGIAHDFNNILTPIIGFAQLTRHQLPEADERICRNLDNILSAAERARELVCQILTFSRKSDQKRAPLRVQTLIKETVRLLKASLPASIRIHRRIDDDCPPALIDPTQIHQVLMNLCTNAYHAMRSHGGTLEITLSEWRMTPEYQPLMPEMAMGDYIRLSVGDTGQGMEKAVLDHIFEPFYTTKPPGEGTGLGLSVVYGIVRNHGGHIQVQSRPGTGTMVNVYLPADQAASQAEDCPDPTRPKPPPPPVSSPPRGEGQRVMVVDDEPPVAAVAGAILKALGYRAAVFTDSRLALEAFRKEPDDFDAVMTDMAMPRLNGLELTAEILRSRPEIPVMLCSGFATSDLRQRARAAGAAEFLIKPVTVSDLALAVRRSLDSAGIS